jgi:hypothetical protein
VSASNSEARKRSESKLAYTVGQTDPETTSWLKLYANRTDRQMLDDMAGWLNVIAEGRCAAGGEQLIAKRALAEYQGFLKVREHLHALDERMAAIRAQAVYTPEDATGA